MKRSVKYIGSTIFGLIILFVVIVNFSGTESIFRCSGETMRYGTSQSTDVYMKLTEYRFWVDLWSDSDGSIMLEVPNEWVGYYAQVEEEGDQLQIYETYPQKALKGNFSKLSKTLAIDLGSPFGFFDGSCTAVH